MFRIIFFYYCINYCQYCSNYCHFSNITALSPRHRGISRCTFYFFSYNCRLSCYYCSNYCHIRLLLHYFHEIETYILFFSLHEYLEYLFITAVITAVIYYCTMPIITAVIKMYAVITALSAVITAHFE